MISITPTIALSEDENKKKTKKNKIMMVISVITVEAGARALLIRYNPKGFKEISKKIKVIDFKFVFRFFIERE